MRRLAVSLLLALVGACQAGPPRVEELTAAYLERYFELYPSEATRAGRSDFDGQLEDLTEDRVRAWIRYQDDVDLALKAALARPGVTDEDRLDAEVLQRQTARERHQFVVSRRHEHDPVFWTDLAANATVFLMVREARPVATSASDAAARVARIPALVAEATRRLSTAPDATLSAELCRLAAGQAQAAAVFYRSSFPAFAAGGGVDAEAVATAAANALATFGNFLDATSLRATAGPQQWRRHYAERLRVQLGVDAMPEDVLARAERDLLGLRQEAAAFGRSVWPEVMGDRPMPAGDVALLRALFARVAVDRDQDVAGYVAGWRALVSELERFVRARNVMTLPASMALHIAESPAHFVGQSVGGTYPPGPFAPEAPTLLFLPVPRLDATPPQREAFFRDFNRHFNRMVAAHELIPGHYVQGHYAARHPRVIRAVFPDPLYEEGWATFSERLVLDLGWGGPLERLAHLKKQLENVTRVIVDVRMHTTGMSREAVLQFARQQAVQDDQFAGNMWTRALATSPQMLAYHLGYREVREVYDVARREGGEAFALKTFTDGMMALGPVPVRHYRARLRR